MALECSADTRKLPDQRPRQPDHQRPLHHPRRLGPIGEVAEGRSQERVRGVEAQLVRHHRHVRVDLCDARPGRVYLGRAHGVGCVHNLPLQVGLLDDVVVHDGSFSRPAGRPCLAR